MFEAETGSGYAGTDWASRDVVQIWQAIENQDTAANYELLTGWRRSHELVWQHLEHVQDYRENLAAAWPPAKSAAAAAYIERLDHLIAHLQETYRAAVTNHQVLYATTLAIAQARSSVQTIYSEYTSNQAKLDEYRSARPTITGKFAFPPPKPPVPDGRQEELNDRARAIMYGLSNELLQARDQITAPSEYIPSGAQGADSHIDGPLSGSPSGQGPTTRNRTAQPSFQGADRQATSSRPGSLIAETTVNSSPLPPPAVVILSGAGLAPLIDPPSASVTTLRSVSSNVIGPGALSPSLPAFGPPSISVGTGYAGRAPRRYGTRVPAGDGIKQFATDMPHEGGIRTNAPMGVIGGTPGMGGRQSGTRPQARPRVNPVGGVIRPSNGSDRVIPMGRGSDETVMGNVAGRGSRIGGADEVPVDRNPDSPWNTMDGVPSVLLPPPDHDIDAGPAIGLP